MNRGFQTTAVLALILLAPTQATATEIGYFVWGGGGGRVAAGNVILHSTLGEPVASEVDVVLGEEHGLTHGYWYYTFCCPQIGVEPPAAPDVPKVFRFFPSAPNPFSSAAGIGFDLPKPSTVRIEVFDVRGAHVRTLVQGTYPAGRHRLAWDGRDDGGALRPSGVYLVHARVDGFEDRHKVVKVE